MRRVSSNLLGVARQRAIPLKTFQRIEHLVQFVELRCSRTHDTHKIDAYPYPGTNSGRPWELPQSRRDTHGTFSRGNGLRGPSDPHPHCYSAHMDVTGVYRNTVRL